MNPYCDAELIQQLAGCGADTKIFRLAQLINPARITIGRGCQIDDFTHLHAGEGLTVGDRVHIATFTSIAGGGAVRIESYAGLSAGCRIISGSEDWRGRGMTNPCIPAPFRSVQRSTVTIRKHALLFTNVIVFPGVEIGEGCVISAGATVSKSLEPWGIYRMNGDRLERAGHRRSEKILAAEKELIAQYGY